MRFCPICGRFLPFIDCVCEACFVSLQREFTFNLAEVDLPFPVYSLWTWGELDHSISCLLYSLKGGGGFSFYQFLAKESVLQFSFLKKKGVYIPAPPSRRGLDHAGTFSEALAQVSKFKVLNILQRTGEGRQKYLSRLERARRSIALCKFSGLRKDLVGQAESVIFIDDVLTTGSTALSAYQALGCPKSFKVLVLAYRPKIR